MESTTTSSHIELDLDQQQEVGSMNFTSSRNGSASSDLKQQQPRSPGSLQIRQELSTTQSPKDLTPENDPNMTVLSKLDSVPMTPLASSLRRPTILADQHLPPVLTHENALGSVNASDIAATGPSRDDRIQAYAMLDFAEFTFYVQTMQVLLGRLVDGDTSTEALDIHLGPTKAISRKHARIFYNFGTQRFELSVLGRNGAFVDDVFVETGVTLPLKNKTRIQIGEIHFKFMLPSEDTLPKKVDSSSKPINATDAVNLKTALYNTPTSAKSRGGSIVEIKDEKSASEKSPTPKAPGLLKPIPPNRTPVVPTSAASAKASPTKAKTVTTPPVTTTATAVTTQSAATQQTVQNAGLSAQQLVALQEAAKKKEPKKKAAKPAKKVYTLEEIPIEYRNKPPCSYSTLIESCLRAKGTEKGMSLSEIYKGIQELYPYYKYCSDGWQSSVRHNLSLNKSFKKVSKEGKGWLWGLDEEYCSERDKVKARLATSSQSQSISQPLHAAPATVSNAGKVDLQPMIPPHSQQQRTATAANSTTSTPSASTAASSSATVTPTLSAASLQNAMVSRGKSIAELASEIKRETPKVSPNTSIQAQLAANRAQYAKPGAVTAPQASAGAVSGTSTANNPKGLSGDTMKALGYLQQELIKLTKDRKMNDKQTTTAILTQALAMTIAQVNQAARNAGIQGNPLASLIDKNPQHVTKILTAALNAATVQVMKGKNQSSGTAAAAIPAAASKSAVKAVASGPKPAAPSAPVVKAPVTQAAAAVAPIQQDSRTQQQQPPQAQTQQRPVALSPKPPVSVLEPKPSVAPNTLSQGIRKPQYYSRPTHTAGSGLAILKKSSGLNLVKPPVNIGQTPVPVQQVPPQQSQSAQPVQASTSPSNSAPVQPTPQVQAAQQKLEAQSLKSTDADFESFMKSISREATPDDRDTPPMSEKELDELLNQHSSFVLEDDLKLDDANGLKRSRDGNDEEDEDLLVGLEKKLAKIE